MDKPVRGQVKHRIRARFPNGTIRRGWVQFPPSWPPGHPYDPEVRWEGFTAEGDRITRSAEAFLKYIHAHPPSEESFRLAISDSLTFMGRIDLARQGTQLMFVELMKRGYLPDGQPEQKSGFLLVHFKKEPNEPHPS